MNTFTVLIGYRSDDGSKQVATVGNLPDFWTATSFVHSISRLGIASIKLSEAITINKILYVTIDRSKEGS